MKKSVIMAMNSSSTTTSARWWCQFMWPSTILFFFLFIISSLSSVSSSRTPISYADHCASIVPEAISTVPGNYTTFPFHETVTGHYTGGDRILGKKSSPFSFDYEKFVSFRIIRNIYKTKTSGVYKIQAYLIFRSTNSYQFPRNFTYEQSYYHPRGSRLKFLLNGFWSESTGKLCMVGSASWYSRKGNSINLDAILKLNCPKNSTIFTSLLSGTLESLSSLDGLNYFQPISILAFPSMSCYNYTLVSDGFDNGFPGGIDIPLNRSISLQPGSICSMLSGRFYNFELEYASKCDSWQNCTPFGGVIGYLPHAMSFYAIQCSEEEQKLRYLAEFFPNSSYTRYYQNSHLNATLVGEGSWDTKKNRLCITACRILNVTDSLGNAHVGDCSVRLSLRFPAFWSIRNMSAVVGQIWTNKKVNDSGYFDSITFRSSENEMVGVPGLKYEYTKIERVRKSCPMKKPAKDKGLRYPSVFSYDMRFDMSLKDSKGKYSWGYAVPIFVGDRIFEQGPVLIASSTQETSFSVVEEASEVEESSVIETNTSYSGPLNISYKISFTPSVGSKLSDGISSFNLSLSPNGQVEISAEGIYYADTGHLCMVGCRKLGPHIQKSTNDAVDCEILVNFQFPPLNSGNGSVIKGTIQSTRKKTDPLYFEQLSMSSNAYYTVEAKQSIWRMDLEIIMVLTSNTLACLFVGLQLFFVKKHPDVLPFISLVMLVILTLGYMIPLLLNFEALFLQNHNRQNVLGVGGWLEVNEVIVRVVTMVAFLLQFRLLQLAWSARWGDGNQKAGLWVAEMKVLVVCLPLYTVGGLIAFFVNSRRNKYSINMPSPGDVYQQHTLWGDLRSYAGLILDGFLFPQILLNVFQISSESALSHSFYIGTTFVRLLPHAYDLYRTHNYAHRHFDGSYFYANPTADFYSTVWDIIIPFVGMLFTAIIFLQQKFGGRCILPLKFRELKAYEKVPVVSNQ